MKIQPDQIRALQNNAPHREAARSAEGFEALLARQIAEEKARESAPAGGTNVLPRGLAPVSPTGTVDSPTPENREMGLEIASRMELLFTGMEDYARQLAEDSPGSLRGAYTLLEGTTREIASLKSAYPDMAQGQPDLAALVNELEILSLNETFKFNRGDYL